MNIEQAKTIPISVILDKLNYKVVRQNNHDTWYYSPFRDEKTPSFHIHTKNNTWYDFGEDKGGDTVSFVRHYLKSTREDATVSDALRWISNMAGYAPIIKPIDKMPMPEQDKTLTIKSAGQIKNIALVKYLAQRGIPLDIASKYLQQVSIHNRQTNKIFLALGLQNEEEGYEVRNSFFKGCVGTKYITFIRGNADISEASIHLFEGFMDYLSVVAHLKDKSLKGDVIILNSLSCLSLATPYIKNYPYRDVYTWFDNDNSGANANRSIAEFIQTESHLLHKPKHSVYAPYKDVNAWHMHNLSLKK